MISRLLINLLCEDGRRKPSSWRSVKINSKQTVEIISSARMEEGNPVPGDRSKLIPSILLINLLCEDVRRKPSSWRVGQN
jgi:hypothetical protein